MAFSTALWEAMSGHPWPYSNRTSTPSLTDTQRRFAWFFAGYDPITGYARTGGSAEHPQASQYGIHSYEDLVSKYPTPAPAPETKAPPVISGGPSAMDTVLQGGGGAAPKPKPQSFTVPENYTYVTV